MSFQKQKFILQTGEKCYHVLPKNQDPVVQGIVSLTGLLVVKILTVLVSTISISQVFWLKKYE